MKTFVTIIFVLFTFSGFSQLRNIQCDRNIKPEFRCGKTLSFNQRKEVQKRAIILTAALTCIFVVSELTKTLPNKNPYNTCSYAFVGISASGIYYTLKPAFNNKKRR